VPRANRSSWGKEERRTGGTHHALADLKRASCGAPAKGEKKIATKKREEGATELAEE